VPVNFIRFSSSIFEPVWMQSMRVVRAGVGGVDVMDVVRADDLQVELLAELEEAGDDLALLGDAVVLDLDEIVFRPKISTKRPQAWRASS
jgi:hypothetical protein